MSSEESQTVQHANCNTHKTFFKQQSKRNFCNQILTLIFSFLFFISKQIQKLKKSEKRRVKSEEYKQKNSRKTARICFVWGGWSGD